MRSVLVHRERLPREGAPRGIVIALHADGGDGSELIAACARSAPAWIVAAPQAARSRNAVTCGGTPWPGYSGYAWFRHDGSDVDPVSFADALRQLALFVDDTRTRHGRGLPVVLAAAGHAQRLAQSLARRLGHVVDGLAPIAASPEPAEPRLRAVVERVERALREARPEVVGGLAVPLRQGPRGSSCERRPRWEAWRTSS
ncbi:MAG TPA: hypothetical protein VMW35_13455 [Myxococcota bacterium]|jgi:hypothetical protein|nr:hypothetical protein [Myxococcota bacterium]